MRQRGYRWLLLVGLLCIATACSQRVQPSDALAYLRQTYPDLSFQPAGDIQPQSAIAYATTILDTALVCRVQRASGQLVDDLAAAVIEGLGEQVREPLQEMGLRCDQLTATSLHPDAVTFSGRLPDAENAAFQTTLVGNGKVRLTVPAMAVQIPAGFEADRVALLPAGTVVSPIKVPQNGQLSSTWTAVQTEQYGVVGLPKGALLATAVCSDIEMLEIPYELQSRTATRLQFWPGESGAQPGLLDRELRPDQVLQVVARWQDWLLVLSHPFPWYPGSASCGWVRADQLQPFDPTQSPGAWVKAGAVLTSEADAGLTIVLPQPLLMHYSRAADGEVLLIHPQDTAYWTDAANVIGRNPFRRP